MNGQTSQSVAKRFPKRRFAQGLVSLALVSAWLVSADALSASPSGELLAGDCTGCHGHEGSSLGPATPTIAGVKPDTFAQRMKDFKTGNRTATIMDRIAIGYTDDEINVLSQHFSVQIPARASQAIDTSVVEKGKLLSTRYCAACHINDGTVDDGGPGILAGQWLPYLRYRIEDFQAGVEHVPKKMQVGIESILHDEGAVGINSVLQFYASQK